MVRELLKKPGIAAARPSVPLGSGVRGPEEEEEEEGRGRGRAGSRRRGARRARLSDELVVAEQREEALEDAHNDEDVAEGPDGAGVLVRHVLGGGRDLALHLGGEVPLEVLAA